jgi:signal transduction histidine kinase
LALAVRAPHPSQPHPELLGIISVVVTARPIWSAANLYQLVMIGAALVAGMFAVVVFYLITQYLILSPVRDLKQLAERISGGETRLRARIETGDEFEALSNAFNRMLARQNAAQDALDAKLGELAEANVALYEANRLKGEFLANVSHELRTPLTSIIGFAELLRDAGEAADKVAPQRIRHFCENILTSGRMLLDIINDLLDLAKIEAGKMSLHRSRFPISEVCEAVIDFTRPLADKKQLDVQLIPVGDPPLMESDRGKVQQIFYNLMSNAIKFTPVGGRIFIQIGPQIDSMVRLCVEDTGPGIPEHLQERIFEKFRQLDGSVTREYGGTGLGLAISRELASILGGHITVRSSPGHGAAFIVHLPLVLPPDHDSKGQRDTEALDGAV